MLDPTTAIEIGRLQGMISISREETHRRIDDWARFLGSRINRLEARVDRLGKHKAGRFPWLQLAAMGTVALTSILGLVSPEKAAAILRALMH